MKITKWTSTSIDINITEARLLTKEEAEALSRRLRHYSDFWWISTACAVYPLNACFATGGYAFLDTGDVDYELAVRPALIFESEDLKVEDRFSFGGKEFEVIKEGVAFCTTDIGECAFRTDWRAEDANQYEKSDIKKYIDKWFKENVK